MESAQISPGGFVCEREGSWCWQTSFENKAILRLRPRKLIFLLFPKIKIFLREQFTSDYLSTKKQSMDKKWRRSIFQPLPIDALYFLTVVFWPINYRNEPMSLLNCNKQKFPQRIFLLRQKIMYFILLLYSEPRSSVPPPPQKKDSIYEFIFRKLNPSLVADFRFIPAFLHA